MPYLSEYLRACRVKSGLSQEALARKIGMTSANYNKLETGKRGIGPEIMERLCTLPELGIDMDTLKSCRARDEYSAQQLALAVMSDAQIIEKLKELLPDIKVTVVDKA